MAEADALLGVNQTDVGVTARVMIGMGTEDAGASDTDVVDAQQRQAS